MNFESMPTHARSGRGSSATSSGGLLFHGMLSDLSIEYADFAFIDFGSGKGKCLLMASDYPFKKIVGVEFSPELAAVARRNFQRYRSPRQKCRNLESVACDVVAYPIPPDPGVYYFYNPFGPDILQEVANKLRQSLEARPRPAYVLYNYPCHREVFDQASWLKRVRETPYYCAYVSR